MGLPLIAFDYDGVLANSFHANIALMNASLRSMQSPVVITASHFEMVEEISFEAITHCAGLASSEFGRFMDYIIQNGHEVTDHTILFPDIQELLERLQHKAHVVVISNNHSAVVTTVLDREGVTPFFGRITGAENGETKEQRMQDLAMQFNIPLEQCWMVGDGVNDLVSAQVAGWQSIAVSWGFQSLDKLQTAHPTTCVENPLAILDCVGIEG